MSASSTRRSAISAIVPCAADVADEIFAAEGADFGRGDALVPGEGCLAPLAFPGPRGRDSSTASAASAASAAGIDLLPGIRIAVVRAGLPAPHRSPMRTPNSRSRFNFQQLEEAGR